MDAATPQPQAIPPGIGPRPGQTEADWIRNRCKIDLKYLCMRFLGYKDWSIPLHRDIRAHLDKPSKFKIFLIPRDHLKSSIITKGAAVQRILRNPNIRVLLANNTWDNSRKFLRSIQGYMDPSGDLSKYFGKFEGKVWTQDEITIRQRTLINDAPTIATTGLEKENTSQHYDLIIADDLVSRENVQSSEQRAKVKDYINSLMALLEPNGEIWVVGTRWSMDDAYGDLIEEGIWDVMQRGCWADEEKTKSMFPEKFTVEKLQFLRKKLGPVLFSCWYLNDPVSSDAADFKKEQIKIYDPTTPHPSSLYMAVDPAHSLGADADFTAMVVGGMFHSGKIRVVDYFRRRVVPSGLVDAIFDMVKKWGLHRVGVETFAFQKTLKYEIERQQRERKIFFSIDELGKNRSGRWEPSMSKEARIRLLQPLFEQGLVEIRHDMHDLVDELLSFPRGKRDDLIDALSYLREHLIPSEGEREIEKMGSGYSRNEDTGKFEMTLGYWTKNHLQKPATTIYEKFFADLK